MEFCEQFRFFEEEEINWGEEFQNEREVHLLVPPYYKFRSFMLLVDVFGRSSSDEGSLFFLVSNPLIVQHGYDANVSAIAVSYNDTVTRFFLNLLLELWFKFQQRHRRRRNYGTFETQRT